MSRYPEAEWRPVPGASVTSPEPGPVRLVLHTVEGRSIAGAEATYAAKDVVPTFTIDPVERRWVQHADTTRAVSALRNERGGVQTNRLGRVIQIELVGFAAETQNIDDDDLRWLGRIILLICAREGIDPDNHPPFVGTEAGTIASVHAPQRMSFAEWTTFSGVCGHQHVPENSHWDPGRFPYDRMLTLARGKHDTSQEDDMSAKAEAQINRLAAIFGVEDLEVPLTGVSRNLAKRLDVTWANARLLPAIAKKVEALEELDAQEIAEAILAGLDPAAIAAAIPGDLAEQVADELGRRLSPQGGR